MLYFSQIQPPPELGVIRLRRWKPGCQRIMLQPEKGVTPSTSCIAQKVPPTLTGEESRRYR